MPATPVRNLAVDAYRVSAIVIVVVGHWLAASVVYRNGRFADENVLVAMPWAQWLTLLFQVIPVFFLAAGFGGAASWSGWRARGGRWDGWLAHRLTGVLGPTTVYILVASAAAAVLRLSGVDPEQLRYGFWALAFHLWFLPVYLVLVASTPVLVAAQRRWGPATIGVLAAAVVLFDVTARSAPAGMANYLLGWAAVYQLGIAWQAGVLRSWRAPALSAAALLALVLLVWPGPYPVSMIGVPGAAIHNTSPPTPALLAYATAQAGLLIAVAPAAGRWLGRVRGGLSRANSAVLGVYLWHMVPLAVGALLLYPTGILPQPRTGSAGWWLSRIGWLAVLTVLMGLLVLVLLAARARTRSWPRPARVPLPGPWHAAALLAGTALAAYALFRLAVNGFAPAGGVATVPVLLYLGGTGLVVLTRSIPGQVLTGGDRR